MNPIRKNQMKKRMVQIDKELEEIQDKLTSDTSIYDWRVLAGIVQSLLRQKMKIEIIMTGTSRDYYLEYYAYHFKREELRRQKEKPPSKELEEMAKYEMSPERVAARTKELEDHRNEFAINGQMVTPNKTVWLLKDVENAEDGVYVVGEEIK